MWGAGRVVGYVDLFDPINSLIAKRDELNADVSKEIEVLKLELEDQQKLLANLVQDEINTIEALNDLLKK